jgi:hypothetical protein
VDGGIGHGEVAVEDTSGDGVGKGVDAGDMEEILGGEKRKNLLKELYGEQRRRHGD